MPETISITLTHGLVATINADDFERKLAVEFRDGFVWEGRICDRKWHASLKPHTNYAKFTWNLADGQREVLLHRVVMNARGTDIVDHIDGNGLNCIRTNLRFVSSAVNCRNRTAQPGSSSRYKGVTLHKATGKWEAHIRHERKKRHLGLHANEVDAALAYDKAAVELWGDVALLNFPLAASK